jgi:hypothetical protein
MNQTHPLAALAAFLEANAATDAMKPDLSRLMPSDEELALEQAWQDTFTELLRLDAGEVRAMVPAFAGSFDDGGAHD